MAYEYSINKTSSFTACKLLLLLLLLRNLSTEDSRRLEQNQPQLLNLANEGFVAKAPEPVLAKEREKLAKAEAAIVKLSTQQAEIAVL